LLELPSDHEGIDDIAAWWTPREPLPPHRPLELRYRISFTSVEPGESPLGRAADFDVEPRPDGTIGLRVDFVGDRAKNVVAADAPVVPEVTCLRGTLGSVSCRRLSERSWRLRFDVRPSGAEPMELSAVLRQGNDPLTETWRYLCPTRK
jgi:glucans biosynthesis protein